MELSKLRLKQLVAIVMGRHGYLPDTDDAAIYLELAACHLGHCKNPVFGLECFAERCGARISTTLATSIYRTHGHHHLKADTAARMIRLTYAERQRFNATTFGAIDVGKAGRTLLRKRKDKLRKRLERLAAGATPHTSSLSQTKPWKALGISRRTWERHRNKARDANSSTPLFLFLTDEFASRDAERLQRIAAATS